MGSAGYGAAKCGAAAFLPPLFRQRYYLNVQPSTFNQKTQAAGKPPFHNYADGGWKAAAP